MWGDGAFLLSTLLMFETCDRVPIPKVYNGNGHYVWASRNGLDKKPNETKWFILIPGGFHKALYMYSKHRKVFNRRNISLNYFPITTWKKKNHEKRWKHPNRFESCSQPGCVRYKHIVGVQNRFVRYKLCITLYDLKLRTIFY